MYSIGLNPFSNLFHDVPLCQTSHHHQDHADDIPQYDAFDYVDGDFGRIEIEVSSEVGTASDNNKKSPASDNTKVSHGGRARGGGGGSSSDGSRVVSSSVKPFSTGRPLLITSTASTTSSSRRTTSSTPAAPLSTTTPVITRSVQDALFFYFKTDGTYLT